MLNGELAWFRRERDVIWVNKPDFQYNEEKILEHTERNSSGKEDFSEKYRKKKEESELMSAEKMYEDIGN